MKIIKMYLMIVIVRSKNNGIVNKFKFNSIKDKEIEWNLLILLS